jgi:hypothetical protein
LNEATSSTNMGIAERRQDRGGPSEYELKRNANIAENHRLLDSLGLLHIDLKKSSKTKAKKGEKEKRYVFCMLDESYLTII